MWAYYLAYVLSLLRLPFAGIPYLAKLFLFFLLRDSFLKFWNTYSVQVIRIFGDYVNFLICAVLLSKAYIFIDIWLIKAILILVIVAEAIRLFTEKGVVVFSALWQLLPHRALARTFHGKFYSHLLKGYINYYILSDQQRLNKVLRNLKARARLLRNTQTIFKLRYVSSFKVVSDSIDLRSGKVRDVARGEIYIHANWTNNPDLLRGLALRRSPWIFDPRFLPRPFYYRTQANRLMTTFVFENYRLCPLYAIYQFGHEIKSARYDAFFRIARWLGYELEETIRADGTYTFDPFAKTILKNRLKSNSETSRPLWTDDEVIKELEGCPVPSALEIAEKYTYPLIYVQEVLLPKIIAYSNISRTKSATSSGSSQCG
jgi:hypothetical protein